MSQLPPPPPPPPAHPSAPAISQAPFSPACGFVPPEIASGFNWGAFWWTWIWGIAHNVWIALLALVAPWPVMNIILGLKGNEWAWQNRRFESVEQFRATQAAWALWGWIVVGVSIVLTLLILGAAMGLVIWAVLAESSLY